MDMSIIRDIVLCVRYTILSTMNKIQCTLYNTRHGCIWPTSYGGPRRVAMASRVSSSGYREAVLEQPVLDAGHS